MARPLAIASLLCLLAAGLPEPPAMTRRAIAPPTTAPAGEQRELVDGDLRATLFLPAGFRPPADGVVPLAVHFHTVTWHAVDEHLRRGLAGPLLVVNCGEGSRVYQKPFEDVERFDRLIALVEREAGVRVGPVDVASFSAGYGAVRELVRHPRYIARLRRIVLCDSLYAGWEPATTQPGATSRPATANMEPWRAFAQLAARGERTLVLTYSSVPTSYANTAACAAWLAEAGGATETKAEGPATRDADYPLIRRADVGHLHLWGYAGTDAAAHTTHVRHLADTWRALDAAGAP